MGNNSTYKEIRRNLARAWWAFRKLRRALGVRHG